MAGNDEFSVIESHETIGGNGSVSIIHYQHYRISKATLISKDFS